MNRLTINPAFSAQPSSAPPNPFLQKSIACIQSNLFVESPLGSLRAADQGCGKLRHLHFLLAHFREIYLVDTEFQLSRKQSIFGKPNSSVRLTIERLSSQGAKVRAVTNKQFAHFRLGLDIIFSVCVYDVVLPPTRRELVFSAYRNLRRGGLYVVIIPRNDRSITSRCNRGNKYLDGHAFYHHNVATFYRNFWRTRGLENFFREAGFSILEDLSRYRQVCLILQKG